MRPSLAATTPSSISPRLSSVIVQSRAWVQSRSMPYPCPIDGICLDIIMNVGRKSVKLWFERALLPDGWAESVLVEIGADGSIASLSAGAEGAAADERHGVAMPGLP